MVAHDSEDLDECPCAAVLAQGRLWLRSAKRSPWWKTDLKQRTWLRGYVAGVEALARACAGDEAVRAVALGYSIHSAPLEDSAAAPG